MVCPEGCGRGSAQAGSAAVGHPRLLAGDTKEEENGEEGVSVLGLEGKVGATGGASGLCQVQLLVAIAVRAPEAPGRASFSP